MVLFENWNLCNSKPMVANYFFSFISQQQIQKEKRKKEAKSLCAAGSHQNNLKLFERVIINDFRNYMPPLPSPSPLLPTNSSNSNNNKHSLAIILASVCSHTFYLFNLSTIFVFSDTRFFALKIFACELKTHKEYAKNTEMKQRDRK